MVTALVCLLLPFGPPAVAQTTISKCQDDQGNWHYGDYASEACAQSSNITEIDQQGNKVRETKAPPTKEELERLKEEKERKKQEAANLAAQQTLEEQLLNTYEDEQAIVVARDERVEALDRNIEANEKFQQEIVDQVAGIKKPEDNQDKINNLEQQIAEYEQAIQSARQERQNTLDKYNGLIERFRALTQ